MKMQKDEIPDILLQLKKKGDGFVKAESNHFSALTDRVIHETSTKHSAKIFPLFKQNNWIAYAAAIAIVLGVVWQLQPTKSTSSITIAGNNAYNVTLDDLADDEILEYLNDNVQDFELDQLTLDAELY